MLTLRYQEIAAMPEFRAAIERGESATLTRAQLGINCADSTAWKAAQFIKNGGVELGRAYRKDDPQTVKQPSPNSVPADADELLKEFLQRIAGKDKSAPESIEQIADRFDVSPRRVRAVLATLQERRVTLEERDGHIITSRTKPAPIAPPKIHSHGVSGGLIRFGACGDSHLCSRYEQLDFLNELYDTYAKEGIETVYHTGNYIEGESRFNKTDINIYGMQRQIKYFVENYPQREGITTYYIAGDDHEGWYTQREGVDIGLMTQDEAQRAGREDLKYLGYMEADVPLIAKEGQATLRVLHPGGGSSYAISYTSQKIIESLSGGEKPDIMLIGHYHKAEYLFYRNIHAVQTGTLQLQSPFMRKKRLAAHLGGWIIEAHQADDGAITRFKSEFIPFYSKRWEYRN